MKNLYHTLICCLVSFQLSAQPWQSLPDVPLDLAFPVVVALRGNIHVLGGGASGTGSALHLRYSPLTNAWDTLAPVPYLAQQAAGTVVNDRIHICGGGYPTSGQRLDSHYYYDPDSAQWYQAADMPVATAIHKAVTFDNKMWILSGQPDKFLCEYYDPATDSWTQKNALPDQNFWYGGIVSTSTTIHRFGGGAYFAPSDAIHTYNPATDSWTLSLTPLPNGGLHAPGVTLVDSNHVFISGGYNNSGPLQESWVFDIAAQIFTPSDSLPDINAYHSMVTIDSCIYSVGGYNLNNPAVAVSLVKNCNPTIPTGLQSPAAVSGKPYTAIITPHSFTISFMTQNLFANTTIAVYDITGRLVKQEKMQSYGEGLAIDGTSFMPGRYVVLVNSREKVYTESWLIGGDR